MRIDFVGVADTLAANDVTATLAVGAAVDPTASVEVGTAVDAVLCLWAIDVTTVPPLDWIDAMMAEAEA